MARLLHNAGSPEKSKDSKIIIMYPSFGILLVDDEDAFLRSMSISLERHAGITNILTCNDSRKVMQIIEREPIGLVLLDLTMPHLSGERLIEMILESKPEISIIIISGLNQLETVVKCIRKGAYDYFVKTSEEIRLIDSVKRAIEIQEMRMENSAMRKRFSDNRAELSSVFDNIITQDSQMLSMFHYIETVSISSQPVLITGESGVGKELIARAIHTISGRKGELVSVNVAGLDDEMFSDTLFGHAKGAYTGAESPRQGMVAKAGEGTLFLDEIGDLSHASQVKLLRLLQEGEYYPLGSDEKQQMSARIIAATHKDIDRRRGDGSFRADLYFRLTTHHVAVPPLRDRKSDLPLLLDYFLDEAARELKKQKPSVPNELYALLANHHFPGNIRELRALAFEAMTHHQSGILSMDQFYRAIDKEISLDLVHKQNNQALFPKDSPLPRLKEVGELLVEEAMRRADGNQSLAAKLLGVSQPALNKRVKKMKSE